MKFFADLVHMLHFFRIFSRQKVYSIDRLPVGLELSDGDKAALYGWPDKFVCEVQNV